MQMGPLVKNQHVDGSLVEGKITNVQYEVDKKCRWMKGFFLSVPSKMIRSKDEEATFKGVVWSLEYYFQK